MEGLIDSGFSYRRYVSTCFWILLTVVLLDKAYMLVSYGFKFTDDDQQVLCLAARDMLHGIFTQPCFYGQSYSPLFESALAVPIMAFSVPGYIALPIVTAILGIFPFVLFSFLLRRRFHLAALFALALPVSLPWFYNALVIMPRGFIGGVAVGAIACAILLFGKNSKLNYFIAGLVAMASLTISPNGAVFMAPVFFYAWLSHLKSPAFYVFVISGLGVGIVFPWYISHFYATHYGYAIHYISNYQPSFQSFKDGFLHEDSFVNDISFIRAHAMLHVWALLGLTTLIFFIRKRQKQGLAVLFAMLVIVASFSVPKVHDGTDRLSYPLARMFLGLPFLFVILAYWTEEALADMKMFRSVKVLLPGLFCVFPVLFIINRYHALKEEYPREVAWSHMVVIKPVKDMCETCDTLQHYINRYKADLIVSDGDTKMYTYGCPAMHYPFEMIYPSYERRTWEMQAEGKLVHQRIILLLKDSAFLDKANELHIPVKRIDNDPVLYLMEPNGRHLLDLMKALDIQVSFY